MDNDVQIRDWHYFSLDHARAASALSRKCGELESLAPCSGEEDTAPIGTRSDHRSYATSSVLASGAFIEACINEFIHTASRDDLARVEGAEARTGLQLNERQRIAAAGGDLWEEPKTLVRYQKVLQLLGRDRFDCGVRPFTEVVLLMKLRNELVHYKPRWRPEHSDERRSTDRHKFVVGLMGRKFTPNPFYSDSRNSYFPEKCLGHGCTSWAWDSALKFADSFFSRVGTTWMYESARDTLQP
ncbi:hypothetical protein [Streptomyces sp. MMBL 11-1]|uniref:hypothetical protein n=1 Tax=Streptomyces sp. MMBL 11-1 TaxID=3026420 RepID=UPI002361B93A|nr:hypothetical protein [Streptomyces sp. MMBL 11-1]